MMTGSFPSMHTHRYLDALRTASRQLGLVGQPVLVGCSGGADSVALLTGLAILRTELGLQLFCAHFNHDLRGEQSAADADWVRELAGRLGVSCLVTRRSGDEVPTAGESLEEFARRLRYDFLVNAGEQCGVRFIALGHTANDQAETVLYHVTRGSGLLGLRGMPPHRSVTAEISVVRPQLEVYRSLIEEFLCDQPQDWRTDSSNASLEFTRNRLRLEGIPWLRDHVNPQVEANLCRLSRQIGEWDQWLQSEFTRRLSQCQQVRIEHAITLDVTPLANLPPVVLRDFCLRLWAEMGWPRKEMTAAHWSRLAELFAGGAAVTSPGDIHASRRGPLVTIQRSERLAQSVSG